MAAGSGPMSMRSAAASASPGACREGDANAVLPAAASPPPLLPKHWHLQSLPKELSPGP